MSCDGASFVPTKLNFQRGKKISMLSGIYSKAKEVQIVQRSRKLYMFAKSPLDLILY